MRKITTYLTMKDSRQQLAEVVEKAYLNKEVTGLIKHGKLKAKIVPVTPAEIKEHIDHEAV